MRLALISQDYPPESAFGGPGSQTYLKAQGLAERGHEIFVITRSTDGSSQHYWDGPVHVTRLPGFGRLRPLTSDVADWLSFSSQVNAVLRARQAHTTLDVVDFPEWAPESYVYLLNQTEWNRPSTVVQLHGPAAFSAQEMDWPSPNTEAYRAGTAMEATCLRLADAIYGSNRLSAEIAKREYQLPHDEIPVLHTGVDTALFSPSPGPTPLRPTIVFAGPLVYNQGVFQLLEAALNLAKEIPDLHVRLVGPADEAIAREMKRRAYAAGRPALLDIVGHVPHDRLPPYLSRAHVLAAPAFHEPGPGLAYIEAMACGVPVIACSGSGAESVVMHEQTGMLVPPGDQNSLVGALHHLLTDAMARAAMGVRARRYATQEADTQICLSKLEHFYDSVTQQRPVAVRQLNCA